MSIREILYEYSDVDFNKIFSPEPDIGASEVALKAISMMDRLGVDDEMLYTIASIRLDPSDAYLAFLLLGYRAPTFLGSRFNAHMVNEHYREMPTPMLHLALQSIMEPVSPSTILAMLDAHASITGEILYYLALDRYLIANRMTEYQFLTKFQPDGRRLRRIMEIYPTTHINHEYGNDTDLTGTDLDEIHSSQIFKSGVYALSSTDIYGMIKARNHINPYTRDEITMNQMLEFITKLYINGIPFMKSGVSAFYSVPDEISGSEINVRNPVFYDAIRFSHDLKWYQFLHRGLFHRLAIILGGYMYNNTLLTGYAWRSGINDAGILLDMSEGAGDDVIEASIAEILSDDFYAVNQR